MMSGTRGLVIEQPMGGFVSGLLEWLLVVLEGTQEGRVVAEKGTLK
jgi:hypothetical protein